MKARENPALPNVAQWRSTRLAPTPTGATDAWYTTWAILYDHNSLARHEMSMERTGGLEFSCGAACLAGPRSSCPYTTARRRRRRVILELPHLAGNLLHDTHTHRRCNARA